MPTLVKWLTWVKNTKQLKVKRIMVDCSATEIGAIKAVFGDEMNILLCHWHIWRAWDKNMKKEVKIIKAVKETQLLHEQTRSLLNKMMHAEEEQGFQVAYEGFKAFIEPEYSSFLVYFDKQWLSKKELWCKAWRKDASFHTNNLIESYHNQIKTFYFGRSRNLRVDCLIYTLSQIVAIDYQQEYVRVYLGFQKPNLTIQERKKKRLADDLNIDVAMTMVRTKDENVSLDANTEKC